MTKDTILKMIFIFQLILDIRVGNGLTAGEEERELNQLKAFIKVSNNTQNPIISYGASSEHNDFIAQLLSEQ